MAVREDCLSPRLTTGMHLASGRQPGMKMPKTFSELAFSPSMNEIIASQSGSNVTILTGSNNSGKSAYLKKTIQDRSKLYIGVNRFYSFHHLPPHTENNHELDHFYANQVSTQSQQYQNFEGSFFNAQNAITRLSNERRKLLFDTFERLFGITATVEAEDPNNDFSNRFVSIGGESLSITSSGTRLFLGILAALMDERFSSVAIDEPELGLSPTLQRRLANIIVGGEGRDDLFPHKPHVVLSTHSHLFLDRNVPSNNWVVSKSGNLITAKPCSGFSELHDIQFRLLGNELSHLFLPDSILFVEGATDKLYLDKVLSLHVPQYKIIIEACHGDIAKRMNYWASSLGDMQVSPYRSRTVVIYDAIKQAGIERICTSIGLPSQNMVEWKGNGIEYLYPSDALSTIYRKPGITADDLTIAVDFVSYGDISYKKMDLCTRVCDLLTINTVLPEELEAKLLRPLKALLTPAN